MTVEYVVVVEGHFQFARFDRVIITRGRHHDETAVSGVVDFVVGNDKSLLLGSTFQYDFRFLRASHGCLQYFLSIGNFVCSSNGKRTAVGHFFDGNFIENEMCRGVVGVFDVVPRVNHEVRGHVAHLEFVAVGHLRCLSIAAVARCGEVVGIVGSGLHLLVFDGHLQRSGNRIIIRARAVGYRRRGLSDIVHVVGVSFENSTDGKMAFDPSSGTSDFRLVFREGASAVAVVELVVACGTCVGGIVLIDPDVVAFRPVERETATFVMSRGARRFGVARNK